MPNLLVEWSIERPIDSGLTSLLIIETLFFFLIHHFIFLMQNASITTKYKPLFKKRFIIKLIAFENFNQTNSRRPSCSFRKRFCNITARCDSRTIGCELS